MKRSMKVMAILMICLLAVGGTVMAGDGSGSGGGQGEPLEMVSTTVADGAQDVALDVTIRMEFSKNVTFDTVRAGNMSAFSVEDDQGNAVDIDVVLAEAVNTDERNFINVEFPDGLEASTEYTMTIAQTLESKSGENPVGPITITFSTVAGAAVAASDNPGTGDNVFNYALALMALIYIMGYTINKLRKQQIS